MIFCLGKIRAGRLKAAKWRRGTGLEVYSRPLRSRAFLRECFHVTSKTPLCSNFVCQISARKISFRSMRWTGKIGFISPKVFLRSFCKGRFPHKSVNLSFNVTDMKNKLTDLCGNRLLQSDFKNTWCRWLLNFYQSLLVTVKNVEYLVTKRLKGRGHAGIHTQIWFYHSSISCLEWVARASKNVEDRLFWGSVTLNVQSHLGDVLAGQVTVRRILGAVCHLFVWSYFWFVIFSYFWFVTFSCFVILLICHVL